MGRHEIGFRLRNDLSELETLRTKLDQFKAEADIPDKTLFELNLILDELFTNVVSCGYRDMDEHWVEIAISREGKLLTLCVMDDGVPFNPSTVRALDTSCPVNERRIGGVGIHLVKRLTDDMAYRRANDRNIVTLSKKLP
ncbi:ATP-binding protein [Desulfococcus sp.]|uniref:ATP-binding protein n=1 Tax=Desulfococcus sp. TaxID=2025834 RepID=UPI00359444DE